MVINNSAWVVTIVFLLETSATFVGATCPVASDFSSDGHLYVTNTAELTDDCECFSEKVEEDLCAAVTNTTFNIGILGDFECGGSCHGFIMNPNYIFWDANLDDWKQLEACPEVSSLLSCADMDDKTFCEVSYCANGLFRCEQSDGTICGGTVETPNQLQDCPSVITVATGSSAMDTLKYIFTSEGIFDAKIHGLHHELYTTITHYRTCHGKIEYTYDNEGHYCPPNVVSSFEEIEHYCMHADISTDTEDNYRCEFDDSDKEDCTGSIDATLIPVCQAATIASCDDKFYYEACTHEVGGTGENDAHSNVDYIKFCSGAAFHCWDLRADQWCQGKVVPTFGSFDAPVCPSVIASCDSLEQFGINHQDCSCFQMNGLGGFVCGDWDTPYCKGEVDALASTDDADITPIDKGSSTTTDITENSENSESTQPAAEQPEADGPTEFDGNDNVMLSSGDVGRSRITQSRAFFPLFLISGFAVGAVFAGSLGYRRYKAKNKVKMRREDLAAALELTAHYRGEEDIDFLQHPRRLMIL